MGRNVNNGRAWREQAMHTDLTAHFDRALRRQDSTITAPLAYALMAKRVSYRFDGDVALCPTHSDGMTVALLPTEPGMCRLRFQFGSEPDDYATGVLDGSTPDGLEYPIGHAVAIAGRWQLPTCCQLHPNWQKARTVMVRASVVVGHWVGLST